MDEPAERIVLGSGRDGRFVAEWLSRSRARKRAGWTGRGGLMMELAQKHKRPIRELKDVLRRYEQQQHPLRDLAWRDDQAKRKRQEWENRSCHSCGSRDDLQQVRDWDYGYIWRCGPCRIRLAGED